MSYIDVLPLDRVKTYLRIDDTQDDTDAELKSMINSALRYIENHTNVLVFDRDVDYDVIDGEVRVYDHPINSVVSPATSTEYEVETKRLYKNYTLLDSDVETLTLNVGYYSPSDVPDELIDLALVIIKVMFYEQETNQSFKEMLPGWAVSIINQNRRFLV